MIRAYIILSITLAFFSPLCLEPTTAQRIPPTSPKQRSALRWVHAKTLSFKATTWSFKSEGNAPPRLVKYQTLDVKAAKPGSLRLDVIEPKGPVEETTPDGRKIISLVPFNLFVSNGKKGYSLDRMAGTYQPVEVSPDLDTPSSAPGPGMEGQEILFDHDPLQGYGFKLQGTATISGETVAVYEALVPFQGRKLRYVLDVGKKSGLPVRISYFDKDKTGKWIEYNRIDYSQWVLNPHFPANTFDPTPPPQTKPFPLPKQFPQHN